MILPLVGCSGPGTDAAAHTAEAFVAAWQSRDGAAACDLLAPETRSEVEQSARLPCPEAVLEEDLPGGGRVRDAQTWGDLAIVRLGTDTIFLAEHAAGWRVVAAGCRDRGDRPYDCQVQGG